MTDARTPSELWLAAQAGLLPALEPGIEVRERLRRQLLAATAPASAEPVAPSVAEPGEQAGQGAWRPFLPGIEVRSLRRDADSETSLWRLQPGAKVPPHLHSHDEECLVLSGSIRHRGVDYFPGDFLFARSGEQHDVFESPQGATFLIRGEPLPDPARLARVLPPA